MPLKIIAKEDKQKIKAKITNERGVKRPYKSPLSLSCLSRNEEII